MLEAFAVFAVTFFVPPAIGVALGRFFSSVKGWQAGVLAALPGTALFAAAAIWTAQTVDLEAAAACIEPDCNIGLIWFYAMIGLAVLAAITGFAAGWFGRTIGQKLREGAF